MLVAHFSASHFTDDIFGRRLAYVALSRATQSIEVLVPGMGSQPAAPVIQGGASRRYLCSSAARQCRREKVGRLHRRA